MPVQLSIKVIDAEIVRQGLETIDSEITRIGRARLRWRMEAAKRKMENYPRERPGQKYRRTGRFFRSWRIAGGDDRYTLATIHEAARYIVGDAYGTSQAWMHAGRWQVLRDVMEFEVEQLPEEIANHISMVTRRVGLAV